MTKRKRRLAVLIFIAFFSGLGAVYEAVSTPHPAGLVQSTIIQNPTGAAADALAKLPVKGKAPKTGYTREQFSRGWAEEPGCNVRNYILKRDMTAIVTRSATDCTVVQGNLADPYTTNNITYVNTNSQAVQIDHVVALSNAWQTGAQQITPEARFNLANDGLNLLAVDGPTNQKKGDSDAATWLPPNKAFRCMYVARQIAVKQKYALWVTEAEQAAMKKILASCPGQELPQVSPN